MPVGVAAGTVAAGAVAGMEDAVGVGALSDLASELDCCWVQQQRLPTTGVMDTGRTLMTTDTVPMLPMGSPTLEAVILEGVGF